MPSNGKPNQSHLETFAKELGSTKGLDPIPPDQYLTYQDARYSPSIRVWAWELANTIRLGRRKAWAVDADGKALTLQHCAADLHMDPGEVRRAWRQLESDNRVRRDGKKLCLAGDFRLLPVVNAVANKKRSEDYTPLFPPYILRQIKTLPKPEQEAVISAYRQEVELEAKCLAASAAVVRNICGPRKDSILLKAGCKLTRAAKKDQESDPGSSPQMRVRQIFAPAISPLIGIVQSLEQRTEQPCSGGLYTDDKQAVQPNSGGASLYTENPEIHTDLSSSSEVSLLSPETEGKAEEEDSHSLYQTFKTRYPTAHYDEPKAKAAFERKTRDQQCVIIERLKLYLECERWQSDEGRWIPLASTWLRSYEADPPPALKKKAAAAAGKDDYATGVAKAFAERIRTGTL